MKVIKTIILPLLYPCLILAISFIAYPYLDNLPTNKMVILYYIPYALFLSCMGLAFRFNRSRIFFMTLLFALFYIGNNYYTTWQLGDLPITQFYSLASLFLSLNLFLFSFLKERGFLTFWGLCRILFLCGQFLLCLWLLTHKDPQMLSWLSKSYLPFTLDVPFPISHLTFITLLIVVILMLLKLWLKPAYSDPYFIAVLIAFFMSLYFQEPLSFTLFFSTIFLLLLVAIIQDSYRMSFLDELTGLPARRALLDEMMKLSGTYTLAMVDIDFFKKFNDKHGHDTGDEVLKMVASCLSEVTGGGKAFRYGGEEFTIVFSNLDLKEALPHLEGIREKVQKRTFVLKNKPSKKRTSKKSGTKKRSPHKKLSVTVSIGAAQKEGTTKSPHEVLKNADKALYRAKKKGRNCVSK